MDISFPHSSEGQPKQKQKEIAKSVPETQPRFAKGLLAFESHKKKMKKEKLATGK